MDQSVYSACLEILREELIPALGCTEPIAIAYAASRAREILGRMPEKILVECSGNIIKNVMGVTVPTTGDMRGIDTSAILGSLLTASARGLEVLTAATPEDIERTRELVKTGMCQVDLLEGVSNLHIILHSYAGEDEAIVEICDGHTNIVREELNGTILYQNQTDSVQGRNRMAELELLTMRNIYDFAVSAALEDLKPILSRQVEYNRAIAQEGLRGNYGANVGSSLLAHYPKDIRTRARALPAAGSDARMGGCVLPVVINSGSGNQGMTVSLPVLAYAEELGSSDEMLYRALALSNLTAIHVKTGLGKLSAYCGVVGAATGAGAGITYLHGGDFAAISRTVTNTLANVSGIVCDGAKPSCAAKIASSVDAAIFAHYMSMDQRSFHPGDGLVAGDVEATIRNIARLGREGMRATDVEILNIMLGK